MGPEKSLSKNGFSGYQPCIVFLATSAVLYFIAVAVNFLYGRLALEMVLAVKLVLKLDFLKNAKF